VFISISDHELAHLRKSLDEIFGESNFLGNLIWNSTKSVTNTALLSVSHTHTLVYARELEHFIKIRTDFRLPDTNEGFSNPDNDPRGPWKADPFQVGGWRPNQQYEIVNPKTGKIYLPGQGASWKNEKKRFDELLGDNRIVFGASGEAGPQRKRFLSEALERGRVPKSLWDDVETTAHGTSTVGKLFDGAKVFDNPKPIGLLRRMVQLGCPRAGIVLDFFSGSGTTAHAVMQLNAEDGGSRRHIQVQLPEPVDPESEAGKAGFGTIADIARERIRRAGEKIKEDFSEQLAGREAPLDVGFRSYKLSDTSFVKWRETSAVGQNALEQRLAGLRGSADDDATPEMLLTELLLKQGYSLTESVSEVEIAGLKVWSVADGALLAVMDEHVKPSLEQLRAVVEAGAVRLVILEDVLAGDDQLKTNLVQHAKTHGVELWSA